MKLLLIEDNPATQASLQRSLSGLRVGEDGRVGGLTATVRLALADNRT